MKADENLPDTLPPHMEDLRGGRCQVKVPSALSPLSPQRKLMPGPARIPGILFPLRPEGRAGARSFTFHPPPTAKFGEGDKKLP